MADEQSGIFPNLMPPPGGLERLHQRLVRESDSIWMRWRTSVLVLATVFICFSIWLVTSQIRLRNKPDQVTQALASMKAESHPMLVRLRLAEAPAEAVTVPASQRRYMAVQRVAVSDPNVIYYRLSVLDSMDGAVLTEDH
jgi:hypothetical protein